MKKSVVLLIVFLIAVSVFVCLGLPAPSEARGRAPLVSAEPARVFDANYNAVWQAIIQTASRVGYTILSMDKSSGLIMTDYFVTREPVSFVPGYRYKLNIVLVKISGSKTQVNINSFWQTSLALNQDRGEPVRWQVTPRRDVQIETKIFNVIQQALGITVKSASNR